MKKRLALVLALLLIIISVIGCSNNETPASNNETPASNNETPASNNETPGSTFPEDNLTIIVPFAPGGAVDVTSRFISEVAADHINGNSIIIENVEGGGAVVGQSRAARSEPDGYTVLAYTSSVVTNAMTKETDYTYESFTPVVMYCYDPEVLVVPAESEFNTLEEFIEYGKTNSISMSTPGASTSHHIAGMILEERTGVKFAYLHNDSGAMQVTQLLGNHVDAGLMAFGEAKGQIQDGFLKVLGIMNTDRNPEIPDVPTFIEKGIDIDYGAWRGLAVPVDTPDEIVDALEEAFTKMLNEQRLIDNFEQAGYPLVIRGSDDFTEYVDQNAKDLEVIFENLK